MRDHGILKGTTRVGAALVALAAFLAGMNGAQASDYFVDGKLGKDTGQCISAPSRGARACRTISYVINKVNLRGHTVHVAAGLYREAVTIGPSDSGTADKPVVLTTDGADVAIEGLDPVPLDDFPGRAVHGLGQLRGDKKAYPRVWRFDAGKRIVEGVIETVWKDVRVDDSKVTGVVFDLTKPIPYYTANNVPEVDQISGSYFLDGKKLYVHPYGDGAPDAAGNNVEIITNDKIVIVTAADYVTLDGFTVRYGRSNGVLVTENADHVVLKNMTVHSMRGTGVWINKGSSETKIDHLDVSHVYNRKAFTTQDRGSKCYAATCGWQNKASGIALAVDGGSNAGEGTGFEIRNVTAYNAWNVISIGSVKNFIFEDVLAKNSPNHTLIMRGENKNDGTDPGDCTGNTFVRCMAFNGQDSFFIRGCTRGKLIRCLGSFDFFDMVPPSTDGDSHGWTMLSSVARGVNVQTMSHTGWKADYNGYSADQASCRWEKKQEKRRCDATWQDQCSCDRSSTLGTVTMTGAQWPIKNGLEASRYTRADFVPAPGSSIIDAGSPDLDGDGVLETSPGGDDACTPAHNCLGERPDIGPMEYGPAPSQR